MQKLKKQIRGVSARRLRKIAKAVERLAVATERANVALGEFGANLDKIGAILPMHIEVTNKESKKSLDNL
jgi:hypothetical protein